MQLLRSTTVHIDIAAGQDVRLLNSQVSVATVGVPVTAVAAATAAAPAQATTSAGRLDTGATTADATQPADGNGPIMGNTQPRPSLRLAHPALSSTPALGAPHPQRQRQRLRRPWPGPATRPMTRCSR